MGGSSRGVIVTRAERKAKKRKLEEVIPNVPDEFLDDNALCQSNNQEQTKKKRKRNETRAGESSTLIASQSEGRKLVADLNRAETDEKSVQQKDKEGTDGLGSGVEIALSSTPPRKSKKERKAERKAKDALDQAASLSAPPEASREVLDKHEDSATAETTVTGVKSRKNNRNREKKRKEKAVEGTDTNSDKKDRFIVFVGNLPFSATQETVTKHFASVKPKSVRHLTQKDNPAKSKGIAFVEFEGYDHMKTCLKLLHHSTFDDGISPSRKVNVELTAGGGGNTKDRREKIKKKNLKLSDERSRRIQEEAKAKWEKKSGKVTGDGGDESTIHPSRRGQIPGT